MEKTGKKEKTMRISFIGTKCKYAINYLDEAIFNSIINVKVKYIFNWINASFLSLNFKLRTYSAYQNTI